MLHALVRVLQTRRRGFKPRATWWTVAIALCVFLPQSHSSLPNLDRGWNAFGNCICKEIVGFCLFLRQSTIQLEVHCSTSTS